MGTAIIINSVNFSEGGLGKVTLLEDKSVESIQIVGPESVYAETAQYNIAYTPADTTETGVRWSITTGGEYATIDQNGKLTVLEAADDYKDVTIKAESNYPNINAATMNVSVKYKDSWLDIGGIGGVEIANRAIGDTGVTTSSADRVVYKIAISDSATKLLIKNNGAIQTTFCFSSVDAVNGAANKIGDSFISSDTDNVEEHEIPNGAKYVYTWCKVGTTVGIQNGRKFKFV